MATEEEKVELSQLWNEALEEYSSETNRKFDPERWRPRVKTPEDLEVLIRDDSSKFSKFRNTHGKLWSVFGSTMRRLHSLGEVVKAGVSLTPFAPASVIVEAALWLIDAGSAVSDSYDSLEELFQKVEDVTDRLEEYLKGTIDYKLRKVVVRLLCSLLAVFYEAEKAVKRGRGREMLRKVAGKENKIQNSLDNLNQAWQTEMGLIAAKTHGTTQRIEKKIDNDMDRNLLHQTLSFDAALDMERRHTDIEESRLPGSGDWLLKEHLFSQWVQRDFPVLCILGNPGTGKSYLASRVITYLREAHQRKPDHGAVGYFYVTEAMQTQYTPTIILKSIASQITKVYNAYHKHAISICKDNNNLLSFNLIWNNLFANFACHGKTHPIFIIIDGLDEALPEQQSLLTKMAKDVSDLRARSENSLIQILLLGRPEIKYTLSKVWAGTNIWPVIDIMPSKSKVDITQYIRRRVDADITLLTKLSRQPSKSRQRDGHILRKKIIHEIGKSADGMFMLAKLMIDEIKDMNKRELILRSLDSPPQGLEEMFNRVVARLNIMGGFDKNDLNELLMWVTCSKRDLLLGEVDLVLKLRDLNQDGLIDLEEELRTRFGSFFKVVNVNEEVGGEGAESMPTAISKISSGLTDVDLNTEKDWDEGSELLSDVDADDSTSDGSESNSSAFCGSDSDDDVPPNYYTAVVRLSHASVGQHFRNQKIHEGIGINLNLARAHILKTCLLFLTDNVPKKNQTPWRSPDLLNYSADHFLDHLLDVDLESLRTSRMEEFNAISHEILVLFRSKEALCRWRLLVSDEQKLILQLFGEPNIRSRLQAWLPEPIDFKNLNRVEARWLRKAKSSFQALLKPFALSVAEAWLESFSSEIDNILAVIYLNAYTSIVRTSTFIFPIFTYFKRQLTLLIS